MKINLSCVKGRGECSKRDWGGLPRRFCKQEIVGKKCHACAHLWVKVLI